MSTATQSQKAKATRRQLRRGPKPGLNKQRRIDWNLPENILAQIMSQYGMSAAAIERHTGLSTGAVYYRCRKSGVRLTDYRRGEGQVAQRILTQFSVRKIGEMSADEQARLAETFYQIDLA